MPFAVDNVCGIEAKSAPFTSRMNAPFAVQFDKHKTNAACAMRDGDHLTCAQCLITCIGMLPKVYDCADDSVILVSRKSIFEEETRNTCVVSNNKRHLQIALIQEAASCVYMYATQCEAYVDPITFCTIDEIVRHLEIASAISEHYEISSTASLKAYVHTPECSYVDISQVADYDPECVQTMMCAVMSSKMWLLSLQSRLSLNKSVTETAALDVAALHVRRHDYLVQGVSCLNKCANKLPTSMKRLLEEAELAKQTALALIGWVISEKESDYVKGQAFYKLAKPAACAAIGLSELEYGNCAQVGHLYNLEAKEIEHYISCLR